MQLPPGNNLPPPPYPPGGAPMPPGGMPPQPMMFYPPPPAYYPPPPSRGGFARAIFTTLAVSILGVSVSLNLYFLIYKVATSGSAEHVAKDVIEAGDAKNTIALLPITGVITDATREQTDLLLKEIEADSTVRALVVQVDSPGGSVNASDEIYERLLRYKKEHGVPIIVSMGGLATSGGYYIACAADHVVAQRTTWTGNIGVLLPRYSLAKLAEKYGIEDTTIKSTGTPFKDAGSMFKDDTPAQTAYWQGLADEAFVVFKNVVQKGRKLDAKTVDEIANGKVYTGPEALKLKLVDSIGYLDQAISDARTRAGLTGSASSRVVKYSRAASMWDAISGESGQSSMVKAKVGQIEIGIDQRTINEMLSPRPLYLWRGE